MGGIDIGGNGSTVARKDGGAFFDRLACPFLHSNHRLIEPRRIHAALVRPEERDHDMPRSTALTAEPQAHVAQWEIIAESRAELNQRQACMVLAFAAIRAVVVRVIDVCEGGGFEACELHARERTAAGLWIARGYFVQHSVLWDTV